MKKLILMMILCLFFTGCISGSVAGYGFFEIDPGVRIYQTADSTVVNITHKKGEPAPNYEQIASIVEQVCK